MIRTYNISVVSVENGVAKNLATVFCDSNDTKPTSDLVNGSRLIEVDTGKCYLYDEEATDWVEVIRGGSSTRGEEATVSGDGKITLPNALAKHVKSLYQYGYVEQTSTPTPSTPINMYCNNEELHFGIRNYFTGKVSAWINSDNAWTSDSSSYCFCSPVEVGKKYALRWTTNDSATVGTIFRFGFSDTNTPSGQTLTHARRTTPQDLSYVELTADKDYLVIQVANSFGNNIKNRSYLILTEQNIYTTGNQMVEVDNGYDANGAYVESLYAVGDCRDEQEVISGTVIRRVAIKVFDGTEDWQYSSSGHTFDWYDTSIQKSSVVGSQFVWCTHFLSADEAPAAANRDGYAILFNTTPTNRIGFGYDTANGDVAVWKAWLVEQYQNGTPVMVIYPLVTEVTETVDPQTLSTYAGTNAVTNLSAIGGQIEMKCTYIKAAE